MFLTGNHNAKNVFYGYCLMAHASTLYISAKAPGLSELEEKLAVLPDLCGAVRDSRDLIAVEGDASRLQDLCGRFGDHFTASQLSRIRCTMLPAGVRPSAGDLMHSQNLQQLMDWVDGQWLDGLLADSRLVTFFQPIVSNLNPRQVFGYECLVRGCADDGGLIPAHRLFSAARATGKMSKLDHAARLMSIQTVEKKKLGQTIFINFNPRHLDDSFTGLTETIELAVRSNMPADQFVFEVVESDEIDDVEKLLKVVEFCREAGCRVALDDIGTGYNSLNLMAVIKPDFIKLERDLVTNVDSDPYKSCVAGKLLELARELDIRTVVEGIETVGEWRWAVDRGSDYCQGFLFGRPEREPIPEIPEVDMPTHVTVA